MERAAVVSVATITYPFPVNANEISMLYSSGSRKDLNERYREVRVRVPLSLTYAFIARDSPETFMSRVCHAFSSHSHPNPILLEK